MENLSLFSKGCLGTCWYGKYHYLEPWAGCSHGCFYCYARFRKSVKSALNKAKTSFENPVLLYDEEILLKKIKQKTHSEEIKIVKLCRFTDIFSEPFVKNGLSAEILSILASSKAERIIITTKGVPSREIEKIMAKKPSKFSYNFALRPLNRLKLENNTPDTDLRIAAAGRISSLGVKTTAHLDPIAASFDDGESLEKLLKKIKKSGIKRAMFSYLLLSSDMIEILKKEVGEKNTSLLMSLYDISSLKRYLPKQEDTFYFSLKPEAKKISAAKIAAVLEKEGFNFVICSLKSGAGALSCGIKKERVCDGTFYA
ncbi:MAG: hypothetical protein GX447_02060 [Elusimicrobia bacterium]|nr:hypothetical protein [Elusimicrobiota bacterium]